MSPSSSGAASQPRLRQEGPGLSWWGVEASWTQEEGSLFLLDQGFWPPKIFSFVPRDGITD